MAADQVLALAREASIEPSPFARAGVWLTAAIEACSGGSGAAV
jgi:hypothetical protein